MNSDAPSFDHTGSSDQPGADGLASRRRAPGVAVVGVAALAVAGWGLADGPTVPDPSTIAWVAVAVAVTIGTLLIVAGARPGRSQ